MEFEVAITALKSGSKIARKSWRDGIYLRCYIPGSLFNDSKLNTFSVSYIYMVGHESGEETITVWNPHQCDFFASDWFIIQ